MTPGSLPRAGKSTLPPVTEPPQTQHSPQDLSATAESAPNQTDEQAHAAHRRSVLAGLGYGALAYGSWGFVAFYFKAVAAVDPLEVLCHRVVWSVGILALLVWVTKRWGECRDLLRLPSTWRSMSMSTVLIAINWLVFIYAVASGRLVEASLGYFINPLVSIVLGMVFLDERLRRLQWIVVVFDFACCEIYTWQVGTLPWISLTLAGSFGLYGLVRKQAKAGPIVGLLFETALLLPVAIAYLVVMSITGVREIVFATRPPPGSGTPGSLRMAILLAAGGLVTTLPLLWFASAARRLRLSTIGFMQYSAPTIQFLIAVLVFGEPFDAARAVAFAIIWIGIVVFVADSAVYAARRRRVNTQEPLRTVRG